MKWIQYMLNHIAVFIYDNTRKHPMTRRIARAAGDFIYRDVQRNHPPVLSERETIARIVDEGASVGRFGDGEYRLCRNKSISFQFSSPELRRRLLEILQSRVNDFYAAVPHLIDIDTTTDKHRYERWRHMHIRNWRVTRLLDPSRPCLSSFFCRSHSFFYTKSQSEYDNYIHTLKSIWQDRDIVLISNQDTCRMVESMDILDNIKELYFVFTPNQNTFDRYSDIFNAAMRHPRNCLYLLSCGPAATVLAYDLHKSTRRSIDIGHLFLSHSNRLNEVH